MANPDSSQATSAELKKQLEEQTRMMASETATSPKEEETQEFTEETEETVETEQTGESEEEETEEPEKETESKTETKSKAEEPLYKIKVRGEERELPLEKIIALAQKNEHADLKLQELNQREEEINRRERSLVTPQPPVDQAKAKEELFKNLEENPFGTLGMLFNTFVESKDALTKEERRKDREFEKARSNVDSESWQVIKPIYDGYRE